VNFENIELLILCSKEDTWNRDFFEHFKLDVEYEDWNCGKNGRHLFYNHLAKKAHRAWLWHMCDDHYLLPGYDEYLVNYIKDNQINPLKINCIVPAVSNYGSISHILSRGWYQTTRRIGFHGNIDSYLNRVLEQMVYSERIYHPEKPILYDFTADPTIMTEEHTKIELDPSFIFHDFESQETKNEIQKDARAIYDAIGGGM
jgi:hypothetical protein